MSAGVYRAYDAAGRLLYVGCSIDVQTRLAAHEQNAPWWVFKDRIDVTDFETRDEAADAEVRAILTEHPRWNINGRSPEHPDGCATSLRSAPWLSYENELATKVRSLRSERISLERRLDQVEVELHHAEALVALIGTQPMPDPGDVRERKRAALRAVQTTGDAS